MRPSFQFSPPTGEVVFTDEVMSEKPTEKKLDVVVDRPEFDVGRLEECLD